MNAKTLLRRWGWPTLKILLTLAILVGVGRQFARDLREFGKRPELIAEMRWDWLALWLTASGILYLLALGCSSLYWHRLLRVFGEKPTLLQTLRAYYVGQLGKYVPGKAVSLLMRGGLVSGPNVRVGPAIVTSFYEVLTTMATGALLAAIVFIIYPPHIGDLPWHPVFTVLLLLGLLGIPLLPGVFNLLMARLARRIPAVNAYQMPRMRARTLIEGMLITGVCWILLGASVWSALYAVVPDAPPLTPTLWIQMIGIVGLSYVAGFLILVAPGGLGVREFFLLEMLPYVGDFWSRLAACTLGVGGSPLGQGPVLAAVAVVAGNPIKWIALAVLLLRVVWTVAELLAAAAFQLLAILKRGQ